MITSDVENFPGFEDGIMGPELMDKLQRQATRFGAEMLYEDVVSVDFGQGSPFTVRTDDTTYQGRTIIIATGASARWLDLPSETRLRGRGVSTCATCDGFFFRNRRVMVIGGGDSALEEALYLSKMASSVALVHRRDAFRGSKIMQQRVFDNPKITVIWDSVVEEVLGDEAVTAVRLHNVKTGEMTDVPVDGLFVAIGHDPNTAFLAGAVQTDAAGYIVPVEFTMTSVPGVFAAGDVVGPKCPHPHPLPCAGEGTGRGGQGPPLPSPTAVGEGEGEGTRADYASTATIGTRDQSKSARPSGPSSSTRSRQSAAAARRPATSMPRQRSGRRASLSRP
jgi:thioredoxin reductase (NADPH)